MPPATFTDLLRLSAAGPAPRPLLIAFAQVHDGAYTPIMCVAKSASDLSDFAALVAEAAHAKASWDRVFVAAGPAALTSTAPFDALMHAIAQGELEMLFMFDRDGHPLAPD